MTWTREIWHLVSQDSNERAAWQEGQHRRRVVARTHERIRWRRSDFAHQHSRRMLNQYDVIAVEDLAVNAMMHTYCLANPMCTFFHVAVS